MIRLPDLVAKAARLWSERPAVTVVGGASFTWAQMDVRIRALASLLWQSGVRPGDRVAWLGFNDHPAMECYYAPALIGAIAVPLNFRLSGAELALVAADCAPSVLIADPAHLAAAGLLRAACPSIRALLVTGAGGSYECALADAGPEPDFAALASADSDTLILFYTSGTTGQPKGVMTSHANLFTNAMGTGYHLGLPGCGTHMVTGPLFHTAAGARIFAAPLFGNHLILMPQFDIPALLQAVEAHRITLVQFVPTMMALILGHPDLARRDLSSLRDLTYGAAPMPLPLLERTLAAFPGVRVSQAFGMTEAAPIVTVLTAEDHAAGGARLASVGRAVGYCDLRILRPDGSDAAPGEAGEIVVRGPNITCGYWNRPDETAAVLRDGWYHTGDGACFDADGYVVLAGRIKDMIITGGENVYPIEVENVLCAHPQVANAAVIGLPDPVWGERVHAVIDPVAGAMPDAQALIGWARDRLAHYKCPKTLSFLPGGLPLTSVGKIDKRALRALAGGVVA